MTTIRTKEFWWATAERALNTAAQTAASLLVVGGVTGILGVAWIPLLSAVGLATLLSVLKSVIVGTATNGSPAIGNSEVLASTEVIVTTPVDEEDDLEDVQDELPEPENFDDGSATQVDGSAVERSDTDGSNPLRKEAQGF